MELSQSKSCSQISERAHRIVQLDNRLANQIAAGEVVERPSSVVKECVENSIDAGARRIEVLVERGGIRRIQIIDDGIGIHPDDLPLALSRHATSKLQTVEQLSAISSLGFRGEALSSIASVSHFSMTSRPKAFETGWRAFAQGRDMKVELSPAASVEGTHIDVSDLFFNTPARRKFLRTEKTEYTHIEDVIKRQALAHPNIAFVLKHNGKVTKRFPATVNSLPSISNKTYFDAFAKRVEQVVGKSFMENAAMFSGGIDTFRIWGWLGAAHFHRSESDGQTIFINGRPVKDRLLSHAIRQNYSHLLPEGRFASYVIYIDCPWHEVDVNVHPTKHEVRFRQPRLVHDLLAKLVADSLQSSPSEALHIKPQLSQASKTSSQACFNNLSHSYSSSFQTNRELNPQVREQAFEQSHQKAIAASKQFYQENKNTHAEVVARESSTLWQHRFLIETNQNTVEFIDLWQLFAFEFQRAWQALVKQANQTSKPLLIPQAVAVAHSEWLEEDWRLQLFAEIGIELSAIGPSQVLLRSMPIFNNNELWKLAPSVWVNALAHLFAQSPTQTELDSLSKMALLEKLMAIMTLQIEQYWQQPLGQQALQHKSKALSELNKDSKQFSMSVDAKQVLNTIAKSSKNKSAKPLE